MTPGRRGAIAALVVVVALIVAIWPRSGEDELTVSELPGSAIDQPERRDQDTPEALAGPRADANLTPCPEPVASPPSEWPTGSALDILAGLQMGCLSDGTRVDLSSALAGKPAVINMWAYWCAPCAEELPALQEYADSVGDSLTVLTVHRDPNERNALLKLAEYGVDLPGVQDGSGTVAGLLGAPNVLPVTIVLRADGTLAKILAVPFTSASEIADAVTEALGGAQ
ncbi:TlpA family protein disulfide reductase [Hoyosella altamirensis]|uniref:Thiol-disulfide isomerase/thioredoxin n=1 Tax=Hoyosella altamirensis TaxID=616997 RepID=A0A839RPJ7_9ACTN|nr:TlpA disulfide reductase family protein [Hoyosella altamirensis]MBB3037831.1 thiol-disulfide isomerase/thioredoxin [Hoyosella altamirensis]